MEKDKKSGSSPAQVSPGKQVQMNTFDERMRRFRIAGRELFNNHFRLEGPSRIDESWDLAERFSDVERILFASLVIIPSSLERVQYGLLHEGIAVVPESESPVLLNRDIASGYWDHPVTRVTNSVRLHFLQFFDWDDLGVRDNKYVRAVVGEWPGHSELVGKHALIETDYVTFAKADK